MLNFSLQCAYQKSLGVPSQQRGTRQTATMTSHRPRFSWTVIYISGKIREGVCKNTTNFFRTLYISRGSHKCKSVHFSYLGRVPYGIRPVQYDVHTSWYNYTRRDGTTYTEMLLSRNGTKTGRYMILAYDVTLSVRCSDAWSRQIFKRGERIK